MHRANSSTPLYLAGSRWEPGRWLNHAPIAKKPSVNNTRLHRGNGPVVGGWLTIKVKLEVAPHTPLLPKAMIWKL